MRSLSFEGIIERRWSDKESLNRYSCACEEEEGELYFGEPSLPPDSLRLRLPLLLAATAGDAASRDSADDAASHHSTTPPATQPFDVQDFSFVLTQVQKRGLRCAVFNYFEWGVDWGWGFPAGQGCGGWGIGVEDGNMPFLAL
nr:hypothetical protein Iba_chr07bCG4140 [Ipomoea batatas]